VGPSRHLPSFTANQCAPGGDSPSAFCLTIGPASAPDLQKVRDMLQAQPPGKFWLYPRTAIGPGDQDYVVWCNAYSTPVAGAVVWTPPPGLASTPGAVPSTPTGPPAPASSSTPVIVGGGIAAAGVLALLTLAGGQPMTRSPWLGPVRLAR